MKTLAVFSVTITKMQACRSGKANLLFQVFPAMAGLLCLYLAVWFYQFPGVITHSAAFEHAGTALDLSAEAAAKPLIGVRNSLNLLSRMPVLRKIRPTGSLTGSMLSLKKDLSLLGSSYESILANKFQESLRVHNDLVYWSELPMAIFRRIAMGVGLIREIDEEESAGDFFPALRQSELDQMHLQTGLAGKIIDSCFSRFDNLVVVLNPVIAFIDNLGIFNRAIIEDLPAVENLFAVALNDDIIRALVLKNLQGSPLAQVGESIADRMSIDDRDCRAITNGSPFFSGPVAYDKSGKRTVWWVAVPVRDESRTPVACLSGLIDLGYLSELSALTAAASSGIELYFTDQKNVVIGHRQPHFVAEQVNLGDPVISENSVKKSWRKLNRDSGPVLQVTRNFKDLKYRHLPLWNVYINAELQLPGRPGEILLLAGVILLAAIGLYVLSCCVVRIFINMNGET